VKALLGNHMLVEDATGEALVRPDDQALDGDFIERPGLVNADGSVTWPADVGVSVQAVVAWAFRFRPDLIASVTKAQLGETACPQGFDLSTCTSCSGRGVVCGKKGSSA
jgi:hypothetical protein